MKTRSFALLPLALAAAFAQADEPQTGTELETITVRADRLSAKPVENFREFEKTNATDLKDIFADQVAVQYGGGNGLSQHITLRGMGADQIDYVVDNAVTDSTNMFHHQGRFMMDPAMVKIVKIEKGTGSASSGIGATSGRIIAETVDADDLLLDGKNVGFRLRGGYGSNSGRFGGFAVYGKTPGGLVDGIFQGNWMKEKDYKGGSGYVSADGTDTVKNSALGSRSYLAKINVNPNEDWTVGLKHSREESYGKRNLREEFYFGTANDNPYYKRRILDNTNFYVKGKNAGFLDSIDANVYRINNLNKLYRPGNYQDPEATTVGANLNLASRIGDHHLLKYGFNYRNEDARGPGQDKSQEKDDYKAYVEGLWAFGDRQQWTLTTGASYDYFKIGGEVFGKEVSDGRFSPNVGLIWDVTDNLVFTLSHNYATRSPRFYEIQLANSSKKLYLDPDVTAERSRNSEIGVKWQWQGLSLDAAYFYQKINDVTVMPGSKCKGTDCTISSAGSLKNKGYEVNVGYKWGGLKARAGVAYSKPESSKETNIDDIATAIPMGRQWMTSLSYAFENPKLEIGWRGRYAESSSYVGQTKGGGKVTKRNGYGVHDLFLNWQPTGKEDWNVNLSIDNVFDKSYRSQAQRAGSSAMPEPGRDIRLGMVYRF